MYIFSKIYLQWIYWTLIFIAHCSKIFDSGPPPKGYQRRVIPQASPSYLDSQGTTLDRKQWQLSHNPALETHYGFTYIWARCYDEGETSLIHTNTCGLCCLALWSLAMGPKFPKSSFEVWDGLANKYWKSKFHKLLLLYVQAKWNGVWTILVSCHVWIELGQKWPRSAWIMYNYVTSLLTKLHKI